MTDGRHYCSVTSSARQKKKKITRAEAEANAIIGIRVETWQGVNDSCDLREEKIGCDKNVQNTHDYLFRRRGRIPEVT